MYKRYKLTLSKRVEIPVGAVVELPVKEVVEIPNSLLGNRTYGTFHIRKNLAMKGLLQAVSTPFIEGWKGVPTVVVKNDSVSSIEMLEGEEVGELWVFVE